jgi:hypothetical protein
MTVIARRITATPARVASEAWSVIVQLLAPQPESAARRELLAVTGIASSLIADEAMKFAPVVVYGTGPCVRIYCLYDDDAITGDNANETALAFNATEGDWSMSLPCPVEDLAWVQESLKKQSSRVTARDMATTVEGDKSDPAAATKAIQVDEGAFLRP